MSIKRALGKLDVPETLFETVQSAGARALPINWAHAREAGRLPPHHADPFDRMLIAQAMVEDLTLVTVDKRVAAYSDLLRLG